MCRPSNCISIYVILQPSAFRCWSSRTSTDQTPSIVRGRNIKPDSATTEATTGSATTYSVSWHRPAATSWDLTCRHLMVPGTTPSTVRSLYSVRHTTTGWMFPDTRVTVATGSVRTVVRSSPHMIAIMTRGSPVATGTTVQWRLAADAGSKTAATATSTMVPVL